MWALVVFTAQFGVYAIGFAVVGLGSAVVFERALSDTSKPQSRIARFCGRVQRRVCCKWLVPYMRRGSMPTLPVNYANITVAEKNWMAERDRQRLRVRACICSVVVVSMRVFGV